MNRHIRKNSDMDPNMLMILLLILSAYSRKPIYFCDKELLNKRHSKVSEDYTSESILNDDTSKSIVKTDNDKLNVLNEEEDSQQIADSDINLDLGSNSDIYFNENLDFNEDILKEVDSYATITASKNEKEYGEVLNTEIVPEYTNKLIIPNIDNNQLVVTVPVLLSQFELEFTCESIVKLDFQAIGIKSIKKNVFMKECRLLPFVNKLFLSGIVRKDIEYSAVSEEENKVKNNIRHMTVEVPFKCTTKVEYLAQPIINSNKEQLEIEMLSPDGIDSDLLERNNISSETFNEKIYCKLISDEIEELEIAEEGEIMEIEKEKSFQNLSERMVIKLAIKLVQDQQICINK